MKTSADAKQNIQIVKRDAMIEEVSRLMQRENLGVVLVVENGVVIGTVTDRDVAIPGLLSDKDPKRITAWDVMTPLPDGCLGRAMRQSELHVME
jgi:predicted transcriptional regulator